MEKRLSITVLTFFLLFTTVNSYGQLKILVGSKVPEWIFAGETIEDAAKKAGLNPKGLAKTVKEYNEGIKNDSDAFGRKTLVDTSGKPIPLDKGPFYIMPATAAVIATYCGLKINKDAKLQDTTNKNSEIKCLIVVK